MERSRRQAWDQGGVGAIRFHNCTQTGAWSLGFSLPRCALSTPVAVNRGTRLGVSTGTYRDLRVQPSEGSHWLRRHTARWRRFARVTVRVEPARRGRRPSRSGTIRTAGCGRSTGPDARPYANDGGLRQEAVDGVRYALERLDPAPTVRVVVTEIMDYLVGTGPGDVKYAAAYALWDALGVEPPVRPYLAEADGTPVFPE